MCISNSSKGILPPAQNNLLWCVLATSEGLLLLCPFFTFSFLVFRIVAVAMNNHTIPLGRAWWQIKSHTCNQHIGVEKGSDGGRWSVWMAVAMWEGHLLLWVGCCEFQAQCSIQQSSVKVSTAASTKISFIGCDFENIYYNYTHTHTHLLEKMTHLPPLISASLQVLPHLPVLWHVLQVALLDTKNPGHTWCWAVLPMTWPSYKQVCFSLMYWLRSHSLGTFYSCF